MLLTHRPFLFYVGARSFSRFASQVAAVAVGWQVYELTGSAFQLGMIGLVQFIPTALLVFVAGHAADRYDRRRVMAACQIAECAVAAFLAWGTLGGWITVPQIFAAMAVLGIAGGFESPAVSALLPGVVPEGEVQRGTAISTGAAQIVTIAGPAVGGFAYAFAPSFPYVLMAALWLLSLAVRNASIVDMFWGPGFMAAALIYILLMPEAGGGSRRLLIAALVGIWGLRLGLHIANRNIGQGEDFRYAGWREEHGSRWWWRSLFQVFVLQGILLWIVS
ncbi:MAG: MFS transporter, partial [Anaerolineae bacterium]|nr:MFS transporter [Anaerolineae bacterium]